MDRPLSGLRECSFTIYGGYKNPWELFGSTYFDKKLKKLTHTM